MKQAFFTICVLTLFFISCGDRAKNSQDRAQNLFNQSSQYQNVGDFSQAESNITEAIGLKYEPTYIRKRIDIYLAQNKFEEAYSDLVCLRDSNKLDDHDISSLIMISYVLGYNNESIDYCNKRISRNKNDYYALFYRAANNQKLFEYKQAIKDLDYILSHSPANYYSAYLERANINATLGFREQAIDDYLKYIEYDDSNNTAFANIGVVYFNMGRTDDALKYFKESLRRKETEAGLQNMALFYEDRGDYSRALEYYSYAINQNEKSAYSYLGKGGLFLKMAKKQEAKASFAKAELLATAFLSKNNKDAMVYLIRANAYRSLGEEEKAQSDYMKADSILTSLITEFPSAPRLYRLRGEVSMQNSEYQKAYDDFDKSFKMDTLFMYTKKLRDRARVNL